MHKWSAPAAIAAVLTCASLTAFSQQQPPPTFKSGLDLLTLEASVRDPSGRPVTDLQPSDFTVTVDGQPRRVLNARLYGNGEEQVIKAGTPVPRFAKSTDAVPGRAVVFAVDRDSIRSGTEKPILDTAASIIATFSPADAVSVLGLPVGGIELTRDHAAAAAALQLMTGTRPTPMWSYNVSWREAVAFEIRDQTTIATVIERECPVVKEIVSRCPGDVRNQAAEMLLTGRAQTITILTRLTAVINSLGTLRAPKHLVLFSGGLPFDADLMTWYDSVTDAAARSRVSLSIVHIDQPDLEVSARRNNASLFGGRDFATGLGNIAAKTGGMFVNAVGKASGALERVATDINYFYQLGVEGQPADSNGKLHRVKIEVTRPNVSVRAPAEIAAMRPVKSGDSDALKNALSQPTDLSEIPFEIATYVTHADEPGQVRVVVVATTPDTPDFAPAEWGYIITKDGKEVGGSHEQIAPELRRHWTGTSGLVVPPGRFRVRAALLAVDGRIATLDLPLTAGLRAAGDVTTSDLMIGSLDEGRLLPRPRLAQSDAGLAMLELSSPAPLTGTTGTLELTRAGTAQPVQRQDLELRPRTGNDAIVVARAGLDLSSVAPGTYTASAVLVRNGQPFARISRLVDVVAATVAPPVRTEAAAPAAKATARRDPELDAILERVGRYIAGFGEQASLIVAKEQYEQRMPEAPVGMRTERKLVAEFALSRSSDATGWVGYRDVVEVDGKVVSDQRDRLLAIFSKGTPDVAAARRLADESARYNIGATRRNFNEPTAALFFFLPAQQRRFAFDSKGLTKIDGTQVLEIGFRETESPTIIRTSDGRDVACRGTLWVVPQDGTVVQTELFVGGYAGPNSGSTINVRFAKNARLGLWLPAKMTERHEIVVRSSQGARTSATPVVVNATAIYSDFKRFETSSTVEAK